MRYLLTASFAVLLAFAACSGDDDEATDSGIEGTVLSGPSCPVIQAGSPCPDRPISAPIKITRLSDGEETTVTSDERGRFRINEPPGEYEVTPLPIDGQPLPAPGEPQRVTVKAGEFAEVTVSYDSGIR